jgi:cytochrome c2
MKFVYLGFLIILVFLGCKNKESIILENDFETLELGNYIESDFPFISGYLDLRNLGKQFPNANNVVARGLMLNLGDSAFACFDTDLLRWSVSWTGKPLSGLLPQISYKDFFNKENGVPEISGDPKFVTGVYAGWSVGSPYFKEVREKNQYREGYYWGPIPEQYGRWNGVYVYGNKALLSYRIGETSILEMPGCQRESVFTRTFRVGASDKALFLNVGEIRNARAIESGGSKLIMNQGLEQDTITIISVLGQGEYKVKVIENRYMVVEVPAAQTTREFTVLCWKGKSRDKAMFEEVYQQNISYRIPDFEQGGPQHWSGTVLTKGKTAPDTSAFVTDRLTLPLPNPWKRNVRVVDVAFFKDGRAAVLTFEGDVWIVEGITPGLERLSWKRFASGLFEPMSIVIKESEIYVFGKEGIVRLHDSNNDNEADYYENFCNLMQQSAESYEWASDMVLTAEGDFFISKGGAVAARPGLTKSLLPGFRAGSNHGGTVLKVSKDGRTIERYATGLRDPFLGFNPVTGKVSVTDQQGNFVPSTPIYFLEKGDFFGVPATFYEKDTPDIKLPLTWIPHRIDRSAGGQTWITSQTMGPLNNKLIHFSFGRPGLFRVLVDTTSQGIQGGVSFIPSDYPVPTFKGELNPSDGNLYIAGFNLFGSNSKGISALQRLRYTGKPSYMVNHVKVGRQGVILTFDSPLEEKSIPTEGAFKVKRWNYKRTEMYGSGHFNLGGEPGEEVLPVLETSLSKDRKSIFLLIPDLRKVDQMEIYYKIRAEEGKILNDGVWFSVNYLDELEIKGLGFEGIHLSKLNISKEDMALMIRSDAPITVESGKEIFKKMGCIGCHSPDGNIKGMYGPSIKRIFGSKRELTDGSIVIIDEAYLKESILEPQKKVVKGYSAEMPTFKGILTETDIESIILYIKRLN